MDDHIAIAEKLIKKANKKLGRWGLFSSKHKDVTQLLNQAPKSYKLAKSWDKASKTYIELAPRYLETKTQHEAAATALFEAAATAFVEAAHCYDETSDPEAIDCLKKGVINLCAIGEFDPTTACYENATELYKEIAERYESQKFTTITAAKYYNKAAQLYYKEIVERHETEKNIEKAIHLFEKAAELFQNKELTAYANQCYQKAAQLAAQIKQYSKATDIFEKVATLSLSDSLLIEEAKRHFFNAGVCRLCQGDDVVAMDVSIMRYVELYPNFPETKECKFLTYIKAPIVQRDADKFSDAVKALRVVDSWTTMLLSRVQEKLRAPEPVKARWSTNKVADLTSASFNTAFFGDEGNKQREMRTSLLRSQSVMHRSPPTGSKLSRSSSRLETRVDLMGGKPVNGILQKGLITFKKSLSMARR